MIGRAAELAALRAAADALGAAGRALIVQGPPGIGKTTLAEALAEDLGAKGFQQLRCSGVQGGAAPGYTALHELIHPILPLLDAVPERQQAALLTAFGMAEGGPADRMLISLASLSLLEEATASGPALVIVEDAQWLDRSSLDVLIFLGQRLTSVPALLLFLIRPDEPGAQHLEELPWERLELPPLDVAASTELVRQLEPDLAPADRAVVVREAEGNPLALREFGTAARTWPPVPDSPAFQKLRTSRRLEEAFLSGTQALPPSSRQLLLLAASSADRSLTQLRATGRALGIDLADLGPVERTGLARVVGDRLEFRHPLVRSAVYGAATAVERIAVHGALAATVPDREAAAWHRALATIGTDDAAAAELDAAGESARRRGAHQEAVAALRRAASLSPRVDDRVRRLALAAEVARASGQVGAATALLGEAAPLAEDPDVVTLLAAVEVLLSVSTGSPGRSVAQRIGEANRLAGADGRAHLLERSAMLLGATARDWITGPQAGTTTQLLTALHQLGEVGDNPIQLLALGYLTPTSVGPQLREVLPDLVQVATSGTLPADVGEAGACRWLFSVGLVAICALDLETAQAAWDESLAIARAAGSTSDEAQSLAGRSLTRLLAGDVHGALTDGEHAARLSTEWETWLLVGLGTAVAAVARAVRGEHEQALAAVQRARRLPMRVPAALVTGLAHWATGLIALADGRFREAFHELSAVAVHPALAQWVVADFAEAAVRSDQPGAVRPLVEQVERTVEQLPGPHLALLVARARALLSEDGEAAGWFERAIDAGRAGGSPVELARTKLAYGEWLRRARRIGAARDQLEQAREQLAAVGARGLAERAAAELDALPGTRRRSPVPGGDDVTRLLTAQELQIARLAATGMSNRDIADQLHLSPRTVAHHLFNAYPKLGIEHRAQLARRLSDGGDEDPIGEPDKRPG